MSARLDGSDVQYAFRLGDLEVPVNPMIGTTVRLEYLGAIHCTHCGRKTKTSFSQGYCYPCMTKLAQCDLCIMSPERCHYDAGTCREPAWGEQFCMTDHIVYLPPSAGSGIPRDATANALAGSGRVSGVADHARSTRQQSGFGKTCSAARSPTRPTGVLCSRAMRRR
jgi:hypothetical protein